MGEYIEKEAAITIPVMPKRYRKYQTMNLDDAYEDGWDDALKCIEKIHPADVRPVVRCKDCRYSRKPDRHSLAENAACEGVLICFVGYDQVYPSSSNDVFVDGEHFCGYGEVSDG